MRVRLKTFRPLVSILIFQSANMDLDALTETDDVYLHVFHNKEILKSMYLAVCTLWLEMSSKLCAQSESSINMVTSNEKQL